MPIPFICFRPSPNEQEALARAAAAWGIEPEYWDIQGDRHVTSPDVQRAILAALGVPCETRECLDDAVEEKLWREWSRLLPPTLVISQNAEPREFLLSAPSSLASQAATIEIRWEGGAAERYELSLKDLRDSARAELRGQSFVRKQAPLPGKLPLGYHDVRVFIDSGGREASGTEMRLIVAPDRAWLPRQLAAGGRSAGIAISLYGVRSARNWGCGDFTDLEGIIDWVADDLGGSFIGLNPLHAIHNRQPFNTSPYLPNCIFYRNLLYLDVERVGDFRGSGEAREALASATVQAALEDLRSAPFVEYERVHALKLQFLKLAFDSFCARAEADPVRREFEDYCQGQGEPLERFAVYSAVDEWIHGRLPEIWVWPEWPEEYRDPDSAATRRFAEEHRPRVEFFKWVQWQIGLQLAEAQEYARRKGMPIGLYHDLALATDRCGSDLWAYRGFYVAGCRVGAPPDDFSPQGQDWAFPPPNAERHRETGYRLFIESIRQNCLHGGALRIDHVMRFFRLFWIPEGKAAVEGAYVRDFHEDLLRILALESVRQKVLVVGEDLGTVEPSIRRALRRFGILSYRLFYFEKNKQGEFLAPREYPQESLVSVATHDLPTLAGFWLNRDIEARHNAGLLGDESAYREQLATRAQEKQKMLDLLFRLELLPDWVPRRAADIPELTGELHNAVVGFLASTPSALLALTEADLLKETEQQNLPGSTSEYPNWRRKMRFNLEELRSGKVPRDFAAMFRNWLEKTGRAGN